MLLGSYVKLLDSIERRYHFDAQACPKAELRLWSFPCPSLPLIPRKSVVSRMKVVDIFIGILLTGNDFPFGRKWCHSRTIAWMTVESLYPNAKDFELLTYST